MFYIVVFDAENVVEVVPEAWMSTLQSCYWPPLSSNPTKLVRTNAPVNPKWTLYQVRILGSSNSYEEGLAKVDKAKDGSDLNTDDDIMHEVQKSKSGRPLRPRRISSDSEESVDTSTIPKRPRSANPLPTPPTNLIAPIINDCHPAPLQVKTNTGRPASLLKTSTSEEPQQMLFLSLQKRILHILEELRQNQKSLANEITLLRLNPQAPRVGSIDISDIGLPVDLPISADKDLEILEEYLKSSSNMKLMTDYLSATGGSSLEDGTRRILTRLVTNSFAMTFSYTGRKGKKPFMDLLLKKAIFTSLQKTYGACMSEHGFAITVGNWLRGARSRVRGISNSNADTEK